MRISILAFLLFASIGLAQDGADGQRDGQIRSLTDGEFVAWDAVNRKWLDPVAFWSNFADRGRGKRWPDGRDYPRYADVSEHDSFLVLTDDGPCLMYFFHTRWRRANDVWRWDDAFNEYGGCPSVFD